MIKITNICICGGGALGHTCAAVLSNHKGIEVNMLTNHPEKWQNRFLVHTPSNETLTGNLTHISHSPKDIIPFADIVLLCLPAFLVEETLQKISPFLSQSTIVGSVVGNSGFFLFAHQILPSQTPLFAFQRVPYISRVINYGQEASLLGYQEQLLMAVENISLQNVFCNCISSLFHTPTCLVDSFYEVTLSNSNPILHTGRLYTMWKDWNGKDIFDTPQKFYYDWTDEASALEVKMDEEFFALLNALDVSTKYIDTLLTHYNATDISSLTKKIKSIPSFAGILSPMKRVAGGWVPDFCSRYFTEDFPFGLRFIHDLAHKYHISCPNIDAVYSWGMQKIQHSINNYSTHL